MAIQDDNTLLSKGDLKAFHEKILPYLGGNYMMQTGVSDYYSTDEKVIGVWLDGKPLYQKTYFTNDLENATTLQTKNISAGFPLNNRPERIVSTVGCWRVGSNPYTGGTIPYVDDNYVMNAQLSGSQGYIQILYKGDWRNTDVYITLQYTKIGDTASSALTTPGAYDLNRPDLWPANKEIFFGNGLYGWRATGNMPAINAGSASSIDHGFGTTTAKLVNWGGGYEVLNGSNVRCFRMVGHSIGTNTQTVCVADITIAANGHVTSVISLVNDHSTTSQKYDIWCTYTK